MKSFGSDNHAGAHPDVLAAVVEADKGQALPYGDDAITAEAVRLVRRHFARRRRCSSALNGTGANVIGLQAMTRSFEAIVAAESAHINVDECGAPEKFLGSKIVDVPVLGGKLTPTLVERASFGKGDPHHVQARVVSIANSTELGTVYSLEEIRELADRAHANGMLLHLDGARLANAAVSLGVDVGELGTGVGVDVLTFGGTKNGALGVEAVVVLDEDLVAAMPYIRKQSMQLASKMRYVSAQFVALLTDDLWRRNAEHANAMARRLAGRRRGGAGRDGHRHRRRQRRVRDPAARGHPRAAGRVHLLRLEPRHRPGALDDVVGDDGGAGRRVRRTHPRGGHQALRPLGPHSTTRGAHSVGAPPSRCCQRPRTRT